ncbi:MAG: hypothetical protein Q7V63_04020 [Gammaproteobacteria bacterium]|nr:hypothetical protein [Gammaproteobacteria bacterium]
MAFTAISSALCPETTELNSFQIRGLDAGLSKEQVSRILFTAHHAMAAECGFKYVEYAGLTEDQISEGLLKGLSREQVEGLNIYEIRGIKAGLSRTQVGQGLYWEYEFDSIVAQKARQSSFGEYHAIAAERGIAFELYVGLESHQIEHGILEGLTRAQVKGLEVDEIKVIKAGLTRAQISGLSRNQIKGLMAGLSRKQVNEPWFRAPHALAATLEIPYEEYKGLTDPIVEHGILYGLKRDQVIGLTRGQVLGIQAGLERSQVNFPWFKEIHAQIADKGIPYEEYENLSEHPALIAILNGLTRAQVVGLNLSEIKGIQAGLSREQVIGLNDDQIEGVQAGLTREQVSHSWFKASHAQAAKGGIPYYIYAGKSKLSDIGFAIERYHRVQTRVALCMATHTRLGEAAHDAVKKVFKNGDLPEKIWTYAQGP